MKLKLIELAVILGALLTGTAIAQVIASPPSNVSATVNGSSVTLSWSVPASNYQGCNIYQAPSDAALTAADATLPGETPTVNGSSGPNGGPGCVGTSYTFSALANGSYAFDMTGWNCPSTCAVSSASNHALATVGGATPPPPIVLTNGVANLSWTAPTQNTDGSAITGALTYNVYQGPSASSLVKVTSAPLAVLADTISGLANGGTDCFALTAVVAGIESAQTSPAVCGTVPASVVLTPMPPGALKLVITTTSGGLVGRPGRAAAPLLKKPLHH